MRIGFKAVFAILLIFAGTTTTFAASNLVILPSAGPEQSMTTSNTALHSNVPYVTSSATLSTSTTVSTSSSTTTGASTTTVTSTATSTVSSATSVVTSTAPGGVGTTTVAAGGIGNSLSNLQAAPTTTASAAAGALQFGLGTSLSPAGQGVDIVREVQGLSIFLAPVSWVFIAGALMWRGRMRARWRAVGFESDVFELFMRMKGGATRIRVMSTLDTPKDRLQVAQELGVDWKTIDRHVQVLDKYGFVKEKAVFGTTKLYEVTPMGKTLMKLFDDLEREDGPVQRAGN